MNGHSPYINKETGNWVVWNDETQAWVETDQSAIGAQTYVVEYSFYYELNVMQYVDGEPTEFATVKLPKTGTITNLQAMTITDDDEIVDPSVTLNYGKVGGTDIKFNGKTYKANSILVAKSGATLSVKVNPLDADATVYTFGLMDSKGNTPFTISEVTQNKTENALTRAASANKGVYDMYVDFANASGAEDIDVDAAYALYTTTLNGKVASDYNVTVYVNKVYSVAGDIKNITDGEAGKAIDLTKCFAGGNDYIDINHVVDCYFEFADKTAANAIGARIEGNTLYVDSPANPSSTIGIKANYLLVDGTKVEDPSTANLTVTVAYDVPEASLSDINWTVTSEANKNKLYYSIDEIKDLLGVTTDAGISSVSAELKNFKWADGTELDKKSVVRNGKYYGADVTGKIVTKFATLTASEIFGEINSSILTYNSSTNKYVDASDFNSNLFIGVEFDAANAFPGEYIAEVVFKNGSNEVLKVPVKLTIAAPDMNIVKLENYFDGNNAVAYGKADGTDVTFDLNNLFKTTNLDFVETEYKKADNSKYSAWLLNDVLTVPVYDNSDKADHFLGVYATREYTAQNKFRVNNTVNEYIEYTNYKFNMTVKSELFEGTFTSNYTADVINTITIPVTAFNLKDVNGIEYSMGNVYNTVTTSTGTASVKVAGMDTRIQQNTREIVAADENAENYLEITTDIVEDQNRPTTAYFVVKRKADAVLQKDTQCKLKVQFTDKWGRINSTIITVTLKKNA